MKNFINKIITWIKANKLASFLIIVLLYLLSRNSMVTPMSGTRVAVNSIGGGSEFAFTSSAPRAVTNQKSSSIGEPMYDAAPTPDIQNRMVIKNSYLSMQVQSVRDTVKEISQKVRQLKGYVVDTNISTPEFGENGTITVRVPSDTLEETLSYFRGLAVKVVSENISGSDITDQYVDIQTRVSRLEQTKATFEAMLDRAIKIEEILNVQREIFNIQDQIDSYKGQTKYMEESSKTALVSINLSTSELGLPYEPAAEWSPKTVFKQAYRVLLSDLIKIGTIAIWIVVFTPLWLTAVLVYLGIKRYKQKKQTLNKQQ